MNQDTENRITAILQEGTEEWHMAEKNRMYKAFVNTLGEEKADAIIEEAIGLYSKQRMHQVALLCDNNSTETFVGKLFDPLPSAGWEVTREKKDGKFYCTVTRCPKQELAKRLGAEKIAYLLGCCTDPYAAVGFNPQIGYSRTKTCMQGDGCCDFIFWTKEKEE